MSMEGFSAAQILHASSIVLDDYIKGDLFQSSIQEKPTLAKLEAKLKNFKGGKENISIGVKMANGANGVNDNVTGFSHTDAVKFYNPANGLRANFTWREHHIGWTMSETQLKQQGILVGDSFEGKIGKKSSRSMSILHDIISESMADFAEQYANTMNNLTWGDGTADVSALAGLRSIITDIPTLGVVGGLSSSTYAPWRNRSRTAAFAADPSFDATHGGGAVTSSPTNGGALLQVLQNEFRQLRRYGAKPNCWAAGSDFLDALETEIRANGNYSLSGFAGNHDITVGKLSAKDLGVYYDPTLDDLGRSKFAYIWDDRDICLYGLEGDWKRQRDPARPYDQFVFHKSLLCTGQMTARRRNGALVMEIT